MDSHTHQEAPRKGLQMCRRQSAMTVMLPMLHMDQLTIKISKAIIVAYWQRAQLFAPVSPALHMSLEWITLPCAGHISPFHTMMYSSNISAKDCATHFTITTRKKKENLLPVLSLVKDFNCYSDLTRTYCFKQGLTASPLQNSGTDWKPHSQASSCPLKSRNGSGLCLPCI